MSPSIAIAILAAVLILPACTFVRRGDATIVTVGGKGRALAGADVSLDFDNEKSLANTTTDLRRIYNAWAQLQAALGALSATTSQLKSNNAADVKKAGIAADQQAATEANRIALQETTRLAP